MKRILLAEDNPTNRELIRDVLEADGCEVIEADNGQEALHKLREILPHLVLLDVQMPELDGYAVLNRLRADPQLARLPVIALTAYAMRGDRERALAAGFDGYVSKPVDFRHLRAEIERLCGDGSQP
ncbi:MAG TPA: response regulator [Terriglobales bacterium]|nr:response regulator [Terriglobales bacterium]